MRIRFQHDAIRSHHHIATDFGIRMNTTIDSQTASVSYFNLRPRAKKCTAFNIDPASHFFENMTT